MAITHEEQGGGDYFFADFSSRTIDVIEEKSSYFRLVRRRRGSAHVSMSPDIQGFNQIDQELLITIQGFKNVLSHKFFYKSSLWAIFLFYSVSLKISCFKGFFGSLYE